MRSRAHRNQSLLTLMLFKMDKSVSKMELEEDDCIATVRLSHLILSILNAVAAATLALIQPHQDLSNVQVASRVLRQVSPL